MFISQLEALFKEPTQHKDSFEDSKYCSNNDAILRGGKKVAITRRADTDWTLIYRVKTSKVNRVQWNSAESLVRRFLAVIST